MKHIHHSNEEVLFGRCIEDFLTEEGFYLTDKAVHELKECYVVEVSVPGFNRSELELSVEKDLLVLRGFRKERIKKFFSLLKVRKHLVFQRSFVLPSNVAFNTISARFQVGELQVNCPKQFTDTDFYKHYQPNYLTVKIREGTKTQKKGKMSIFARLRQKLGL